MNSYVCRHVVSYIIIDIPPARGAWAALAGSRARWATARLSRLAPVRGGHGAPPDPLKEEGHVGDAGRPCSGSGRWCLGIQSLWPPAAPR
jgi:hypothetical protein